MLNHPDEPWFTARTKLQRKRWLARARRLMRRSERKLLDYHVALDPRHECVVSRSAYHHKTKHGCRARCRPFNPQSFHDVFTYFFGGRRYGW